MKRFLFTLLVSVSITFSCVTVQAKGVSALDERVNAAVATQMFTQANQLTAVDAYDTPLVILLARQGDVGTLRQLAQKAPNGNFLNALDKYGNNLFHVAKDVTTVQAIASLMRQFYGDKVSEQISAMVNQRNTLHETPLHTQINAGHADVFRTLYRYSLLRQKRKQARHQLTRLQGSELYAQHKEIYCDDIRRESSAKGYTLLQAAQAQVPYHPEMAPLVQFLERMSCVSEN